MRVLAEEGVLLALGTVLAVMTGIRTDAVFIAGLLLAVSVTGLVEWLHADERWPWLPCVAYLIVAAAVPAWCSFMPLVAYDMARLAAAGRPSRLVTAVRWLWVLPFAALWFVRVSHAGVAAGAADANSHMQALALTLTALLGFVAGRSREASDGNRRALLHAQDMAREASRSVRSRIADIDEERAQSVRMATLGERTRIAREIHDNVGHLLTRAIMQAQAGRAVAEATDKGAFSIAGGGDTISAVNTFGIKDRVSYISTGGGAFLEFLEGKTLPAVAVLEERSRGEEI